MHCINRDTTDGKNIQKVLQRKQNRQIQCRNSNSKKRQMHISVQCSYKENKIKRYNVKLQFEAEENEHQYTSNYKEKKIERSNGKTRIHWKQIICGLHTQLYDTR